MCIYVGIEFVPSLVAFSGTTIQGISPSRLVILEQLQNCKISRKNVGTERPRGICHKLGGLKGLRPIVAYFSAFTTNYTVMSSAQWPSVCSRGLSNMKENCQTIYQLQTVQPASSQRRSKSVKTICFKVPHCFIVLQWNTWMMITQGCSIAP